MPYVEVNGQRLEYERLAGAQPDSATVVMLHEGLGSLSMWKDFPARVAAATGCTVVAYSRRGYGRSSPLAGAREVTYMHEEALQTLPLFLDALQIRDPVLLGHSDGASIAIIHAGGSGRSVRGIALLAPHVMVEDLSVASIAQAKTAYETTNLRERLGRYHDDVDGVFWGWNRIWLDPAFRAWNIEEFLPRIRCSVLAIQGLQDEYGTMEQLRRTAQRAPRVRLLELEDCGHSPHRDRTQAVLEALADWIQEL